MTKFIKLTESNGPNSTVLLNVASIGAIQSGNRKDVYVRMTYNMIDKEGKPKTEYYFVKESIDDIWMMLNPDQYKINQEYKAGVETMRKSMTPNGH